MAFTGRQGNNSFQKQKLDKTAKRRNALTASVELDRAASNDFGRNDLLPDVHIGIRAVEELKPAARRTRKPNTPQLERMIQSIRRFGFVGAIFIRDDRIVDGHIRHAAAIKLQMEEIPCIDVAHLSASECNLLAITINRLSELGEWDLDALRIEFQEAIELNFDLDITGFSTQEQDIILLDDQAPDEAAEEVVPELPVQPTSLVGDVWQLGDHRIICGNALDPVVYTTLLGQELVTVIIADFPYNVEIANNVSGLGKKKHGEFVMASGEMADEQFALFLKDAIICSAAHLIERGVYFGFMDWRSIEVLIRAGGHAGLTMINFAVWNKGSGGMGTLYRSTHELIPVFCKGEAPATNNVFLGKHGRDRTNVFSYPGANKRGSSAAKVLADHPTPKPIALCADMLLDVSHRGDAVLDPFLGSGTTIIAAEQTGRIGYGIELDPKYVDVAVRRWEQLTGRPAIHAATSRTFAELTAARSATSA
jgi:DNA modification methylase